MWKRFKMLSAGAHAVILGLLFVPALYFASRVPLAISFWLAWPSHARSISEVTVATIVEETGLFIPKDATLTDFTETPTMDPSWVARILIPASARNPFVERATTMPEEQGIFVDSLASSTPWWKPKDIVFQRRYLQPQTHVIVKVILSQDSGEFVAYVELDSP